MLHRQTDGVHGRFWKKNLGLTQVTRKKGDHMAQHHSVLSGIMWSSVYSKFTFFTRSGECGIQSVTQKLHRRSLPIPEDDILTLTLPRLMSPIGDMAISQCLSALLCIRTCPPLTPYPYDPLVTLYRGIPMQCL